MDKAFFASFCFHTRGHAHSALVFLPRARIQRHSLHFPASSHIRRQTHRTFILFFQLSLTNTHTHTHKITNPSFFHFSSHSGTNSDRQKAAESRSPVGVVHKLITPFPPPPPSLMTAFVNSNMRDALISLVKAVNWFKVAAVNGVSKQSRNEIGRQLTVINNSITAYLFIYLAVCLYACLPTHLTRCLFIYTSMSTSLLFLIIYICWSLYYFQRVSMLLYLPMYTVIHWSINSSACVNTYINLPIWISTSLFIHHTISLSVFLLICLFV